MTTPYPKALADFPTVRQSLLSKFDLCALSTNFELRWAKGWNSHPAARGRIAHQVFARCLEDMARAEEPTIETDVALAHLHHALRQADIPDEDVVNIPMKEVKDLYWVVIKWAHDNSWDIANLIDVEHRLFGTLYYDNPKGGFVERVLTGQLDALIIRGEYDDEAIVLDWKDTWDLPTRKPDDRNDALSVEGYFQQRFYAWLVMKNYEHVQKVTLREFYVRYSEPREATVWRERLQDVEDELSALVERFDRAYEKGKTWHPTPGKHCHYCVRPAACPIFPKARGEGQIRTQKEAREVADQLIVSEAVFKRVRAALSAWSAVRGHIPVRNPKRRTVWGHRRQKRTKSPKPEQVQAEIERAQAGLPTTPVDQLYRTTYGTKFEAHVPEQTEGEEDKEMIAALKETLAESKAERKAKAA